MNICHPGHFVLRLNVEWLDQGSMLKRIWIPDFSGMTEIWLLINNFILSSYLSFVNILLSLIVYNFCLFIIVPVKILKIYRQYDIFIFSYFISDSERISRLVIRRDGYKFFFCIKEYERDSEHSFEIVSPEFLEANVPDDEKIGRVIYLTITLDE